METPGKSCPAACRFGILDRALLLSVPLACLLSGPAPAETFSLAIDGQPRAVILVPEKAEPELLAGAKDLVEFIEKMSGAKLAILKPNEAAPDGMNTIQVGRQLAEPVQDLLLRVADSEAGFVVAVRGSSLHLAGQSPLASSFACSELLERLGCRWLIPGELGEIVPKRPTLDFDGPDVVEKPDFNPRWLRVDPVWSRRNKLGGTNVPAAHSFFNFVNPKEFELHPDWFPLRNGQRQAGGQLCLSHPEVIQRFIERSRDYFRKNPAATGISLGPNDGGGWCECKGCESMDSGRIDSFAGERDVTDRLVRMMNAVAEEVSKEFPGKKYGFYAYSNYQLPPVKVKPHPSLIPVFAPIAYCRLHSMSNPRCPDRHAVRKIYEGWAQHGLELHYRGYTFNLAGLQTPFHCFHKWIDDMPWMREHNIRGFFPESIESWSASAPHYYLTARLAWRVTQDPRHILEDFCNGLFGAAAGPAMNRYFWRLADALHNADFHSGNDTNVPDIYTPEVMGGGAKDLEEASGLAQTDREKKCVSIFQKAHDYLQAFLDMQRFQNEFDFARSKEALDRLVQIQDALIAWDGRFLSTRAAKSYLRRFWGPAVEQAHQKTSAGNEMVARFPDEWQFFLDPNDAGEWMELHRPEVRGGNWQTIKTFSASWADQGLNYYKGVAWYRTVVDVAAPFQGRRVFLWLGGIDEAAKVWLNGQPISYELVKKDKKTGAETRETTDTLRGSWRPLQIEVTPAIRFGGPNLFVLKLINRNLDELGTGGIMKVAMLYAAKPD
ncbi:MAG: DUF4838 domain-containing protein [Planctomycetes bacterium]|nr:DUF4838 domain-containing protein [Planctomycetota bacterium]